MLTRIDRMVALTNVLGNYKCCKHGVGFRQYLKNRKKSIPHNSSISILDMYLKRYWI